MKKNIVLLLIISLLAFSFVACSKDDAETDVELNKELMKLMPNEGFKWAYNGAADYYHEMMLNSITEDEKEIIYKIDGEVKDVVSGDTEKDYNIELYYQITGDSLIQVKTAPMMLESEYDHLTIIKAPLEKGTKWTEEVTDSRGKKVTIEGEIIEVDDDERGNIYKVSYRNTKTDYSESRKIMENFGVIAFTKLVEIQDKRISQGYGLYGLGSGYVKTDNSDGTTSVTDPTDTEDAADSTDATDSTDLTDTTDSEDATETTDSTESTESTESTTEDSDADEEEAVKQAIESFNDAWINYVNDNNQSYFNYITSDGIAYKNAKSFNRTGLTEEFLVMKVNQVNVAGNVATAKVYEEIKKTKDGSVTIAKYNWVYNLEKKNGKWLIDGYKKQ